MVIINYGTSEHFEKNIGDKFYCKSFSSAKKFLKERLGLEKEGSYWEKYVLDRFDLFEHNCKSCNFSSQNISCKSDGFELYINLEEKDLI